MQKKLCKICKVKFTPYNPLQMVCSPVCAYEYAKKSLAKKESKEWKEKRKKIVEDLMTLPQLKKKAKAVFQKWVRMRDAKLPCISCGRDKAVQWDGGHYMKSEIYSGIIFNELNVNKQCSYCNDYLAGNVLEYRKGMIAKYGLKAVEELEELADKTRIYKWSKSELLEIIKKYKL